MTGADVETAVNGQEGVDKVASHPSGYYQLVFMDIQMPIMNGYEATKLIRNIKTGQNVPIIAITAGTEKEEKEKCIKSGMDDYIPKPIIKGIIEETFLKWVN